MTNYAFSDLPPSAGLADADLFAVTDDPAGTPASQKATAAQVAAYVHAETSDMTEATVAGGGDFVPARVSGNTRKLAIQTILQTLRSLTSLGSNVDPADRLLITDESAAGDPAKYVDYESFMASIKNLPEATVPPSDGKLLIVDSGASDAFWTSLPNLLAGIDNTSLFAAFAATIDGAADRMFYWDDSAGAIRGISPDQLGQVRQTIWVPARAWKPRTTNGPAEGNTELSTNKRMVVSLDFDASVQEYAEFSAWLPKSWDLSSMAYRAAWTTATGSGGVTWSVACRADSDDDALDQAMGTAVLVTDTRIADNDLHITAESAALNAGGTPAELDLVTFVISRAVGDGGDTKTGDAKFLGLHLYFNTRFRSDV
ncbi:hypothetical protein EDC65_2236 [Stella humosa]|uniref:Uncharacterized protein n=1 Tax=Stella humosa TaxID=94 RepID=A0A3N1MCK2_9PROT|nr:hypothetical protein [Stella humosa]ROQ00437.1 hypothetical protein EDC65_2236 [Stella humosa]BBK30319.1 hypothetical protein STHU_09530 [Stella humosa]